MDFSFVTAVVALVLALSKGKAKIIITTPWPRPTEGLAIAWGNAEGLLGDVFIQN